MHFNDGGLFQEIINALNSYQDRCTAYTVASCQHFVSRSLIRIESQYRKDLEIILSIISTDSFAFKSKLNIISNPLTNTSYR